MLPISSGTLANIFIGLLAGLLISCGGSPIPVDEELAQKFDSLTRAYSESKPEFYERKIDSLRSYISTEDPLIAEYYFQKAQLHNNDVKVMQLYADSCFNYYDNKKKINDFQKGYLKSLMVKAQSFFAARHYTLALSYYLEGNQIVEEGHFTCEAAQYSNSIARIYFDQKRYVNSRKRYQQYLIQLKECDQPKANFFANHQNALTMIGLTYEREKKLDTARLYYEQALTFIDSISRTDKINSALIQKAQAETYNYLAGVYLQSGSFSQASDYLKKSFQLSATADDDKVISMWLNMAELQIQENNLSQAKIDLQKSNEVLAGTDLKKTHELRLRWLKLNAMYYEKEGKSEKAYQNLNLFLRFKDSMDLVNFSLYQFDIDREFNLLARDKRLDKLTAQDNFKTITLIAGTVCLILLIAISMLLYSNLKRRKWQNKNIRTQNHSLQKALERLEQTNKNQIRIMRVMSHDFKNPLVGISGMASILVAEENDEERKEMLTLIEESSSKAIRMINDLLKHGLEENETLVDTQKIYLDELMDSSIYLLKYNAAQKDQEFIYHVPEGILIEVNQEKMWRVFNNIIVNAIKFSHPGGKIEIEAHTENQWVIVSFKDNGIGIPKHESEEVFKMFSAAKKSGTAGEQSFGLGLSISKRIMELHGGTIWFENNPEGGTIFYIKLPLAKN